MLKRTDTETHQVCETLTELRGRAQALFTRQLQWAFNEFPPDQDVTHFFALIEIWPSPLAKLRFLPGWICHPARRRLIARVIPYFSDNLQTPRQLSWMVYDQRVSEIVAEGMSNLASEMGFAIREEEDMPGRYFLDSECFRPCHKPHPEWPGYSRINAGVLTA